MAQSDEVIALADDKGAVAWKAFGMMNKGCALALTGKSTDALPMLISGLAAFRSTGATLYGALCLSSLARAYADIGKFDDARRSIDEAITLTQTTKERWYEGEILRTSGEIILLLRDSNAGKAEAYFERALAIARQQQAKSWELRAATSMARLWRDHGKSQQARELLAPVYGWFTEGFDTRDLKEAGALLEQLGT